MKTATPLAIAAAAALSANARVYACSCGSSLPAIVYEVEHAGLPALCTRHLPGLAALVRATNGATSS